MSALNVDLMNQIDKIYTEQPYYGRIKITEQLKRDGTNVNHKRVGRLMRIMGIQAIIPRKNTSKNNPSHMKYRIIRNTWY